MLKKTLKTLIVLAVIGIVVYKAYEYFTKDDRYEEVEDDLDEEFELEDEETLADKVRAAVKKLLNR